MAHEAAGLALASQAGAAWVLRNEPHAKGLAFYQLAIATADWVMWIWLADDRIFSGGTAIVVGSDRHPLPARLPPGAGHPRRLDHDRALARAGDWARAGDLMAALSPSPSISSAVRDRRM